MTVLHGLRSTREHTLISWPRLSGADTSGPECQFLECYIERLGIIFQKHTLLDPKIPRTISQTELLRLTRKVSLGSSLDLSLFPVLLQAHFLETLLNVVPKVAHFIE